MSNQRLAEELQQRLIRKCKKRKVHSSFVENIWYDDLADVQLISRFNKRFRFLWSNIGIYSIYPWKKLVTIEILTDLGSYCYLMKYKAKQKQLLIYYIKWQIKKSYKRSFVVEVLKNKRGFILLIVL